MSYPVLHKIYPILFFLLYSLPSECVGVSDILVRLEVLFGEVVPEKDYLLLCFFLGRFLIFQRNFARNQSSSPAMGQL